MADNSRKENEKTRRGASPKGRKAVKAGVAAPPPAAMTPADETVRRMMENALARAAAAEEALEAAERRLQWLESCNIYDEVTGLLNRKGLKDALRYDLARARRYGDTGALLLLDVMGFDGVREEHGSGAANYLLTAIGNILRTRFREVDQIGSLDGGRFAAALTLIGHDDARKRAAMLKGYLDEVEVPWQGQNIPVKVRIGLAFYGQRDAVDDLLERAEAELEEREQRVARLQYPAE